MRSTITIEDSLFEQAAKVCGEDNISTVVTTALTEYIRRAAAQRLIALGGTAPNLPVPEGARYGAESGDSLPMVAEGEADYPHS